MRTDKQTAETSLLDVLMKFAKNIEVMIKCQGAEWIYDTDDDNEPLGQTLPLQNELLEMKINKEQTTFNIYKQVT